jgi:hypothetical protein
MSIFESQPNLWKMWYLPLTIFGILLYVIGVGSLNPILEFNELTLDTGTVEHAVPDGRKSTGEIVLRTNSGDQKTFEVSLTREKAQRLRGQRVTVGSQRIFDPLFFRVDHAWQVQIGDEIVIGYSKPRLERLSVVFKKIIKFSAGMVLISLLGLWWGRRKSRMLKQTTDQTENKEADRPSV